ncbi:MAG TPA: BON domain-containing protein, partial [Candidatus Binatia bacterium]|nr:BON domain-containing protein [Candidatus Binatia bacterium]
TSNRPSPQGQSDERPGPAAENIAAAEPKPAAKPPPSPPSVGDEGQGSRAEPLEARSKQLEAQVQRAIQIRAINGVEVSVANGTAILEGRVASERQKRAAERAANSVSGVQRVRNRLVVG